MRITRRQLGLAVAGIAAAQQSSSQSDDRFDPVRWTMQRHSAAPLRLTFRARTKSQAAAWQRSLRTKLRELVGGFPEKREPLRAETLEIREFPNYKREKFIFESRPGVGVLGYLLTPTAERLPMASVICLPGHGRGVDDIVGIDPPVSYQKNFALQAVEHGLAAVAIEPMAFGYRRDPLTRSKGPAAYACQPVAGSALLLGETMLGWRVFDVMRTIDWIQTRSELDPARVGCMGISGGGTSTLFAAALEPRIRAAMVSGYLNTFRASIMSLSHCMDNYVPGILQWAEMYDVAGLIAPRPVFFEGGDRDPIFPVEAARESFTRVKNIYEVFGASDSAQQEIFEGEHEFHGKLALPFLHRALTS